MKKHKSLAALLLALVLVIGCVPIAAALEDVKAAIPMAAEMPSASGQKVEKNNKASIDYSNTSDGYIMTKYTASTSNRLKVQVVNSVTYTYDLPAGTWVTFPLSEGSGSYKVTVYEQNPATGKYATVLSVTFQVSLSDEFAPFLRPNQYVDYSTAEDTVAEAAKLLDGETDTLKKVQKIYDYVVTNLTYDQKKAATVQSGYLPVLDAVLEAKTGICFDYASLMTGMLRSQGIPCKLMVGFAGTVYHAWISVWTEEAGWVDNIIYFDGTTWHRMDPTFASSGNGSESIMKYIGNGSNYAVKFMY